MIVYPYQSTDQKNFFPLVPLKVLSRKKFVDTFALVDSGATISIFREDIAKQLGIKIEKGEKTYLGGVGGRIKGYIHKLEIRAAGKKILCPVVFSYEFTVSFNLLGREAFFKRFRIIFEEKKKVIKLE